jgi:pyruvate kinase
LPAVLLAGIAEIGVSYEKLASSLAPGRVIKMADGGLSIKVQEVIDGKRIRGM